MKEKATGWHTIDFINGRMVSLNHPGTLEYIRIRREGKIKTIQKEQMDAKQK